MRRLFLERVLSAQEEERRRIARELHDEAGQLLTSLLVGLRAIEDCETITDAKAKGRRLRKITTLALDEVGRLARGLHPTVLEDHGLAVALRRYIAEYTKIHNVAVGVNLSERQSKGLSQTVQLGVYRILQEALTNVSRHARAKTAKITFTRSATALEIVVVDDGQGFDTKSVTAAASDRLGIQSMRERVALLRGTVGFQTKGNGTKITVNIPLTEDSVGPAKTDII
jgi:signal transduction histidine kinase